jgi:hypothetical protein
LVGSIDARTCFEGLALFKVLENLSRLLSSEWMKQLQRAAVQASLKSNISLLIGGEGPRGLASCMGQAVKFDGPRPFDL